MFQIHKGIGDGGMAVTGKHVYRHLSEPQEPYGHIGCLARHGRSPDLAYLAGGHVAGDKLELPWGHHRQPVLPVQIGDHGLFLNAERLLDTDTAGIAHDPESPEGNLNTLTYRGDAVGLVDRAPDLARCLKLKGHIHNCTVMGHDPGIGDGVKDIRWQTADIYGPAHEVEGAAGGHGDGPHIDIVERKFTGGEVVFHYSGMLNILEPHSDRTCADKPQLGERHLGFKRGLAVVVQHDTFNTALANAGDVRPFHLAVEIQLNRFDVSL